MTSTKEEINCYMIGVVRLNFVKRNSRLEMARMICEDVTKALTWYTRMR